VHDEAIRKANVLIEALGYIRKFHGRFTVIKLGGSVMEDPESLRALLVDVVFMQTVGMRPVLVHGGGPLTLPGADGDQIDLGRVGEVTEVEAKDIENFCLAGVVPVLPSLAEADDGGLLNVNADTAAAAVAMALEAEKLVFLTDTSGILRDRADPASLLRGLTPEGCRALIDSGVIDKGMIPKVEACLASLEAGVRKIHIIDGRLPHALLLEMYTDTGIGTEIARGPDAEEHARKPVLARH
jgi:acetylglutamate kinase